MFRKDLSDRLEAIFGFRKTTYQAPSDQFEQDTLFIQIDECHSRATEGTATSKVMGTLTVYTQHDKMPFGFFNKRIQQADAETVKPLFFFEIEQDIANSPARIQNISERRTRFQFLYSEQYDPNQGVLNELEFTSVEFSEEIA